MLVATKKSLPWLQKLRKKEETVVTYLSDDYEFTARASEQPNTDFIIYMYKNFLYSYKKQCDLHSVSKVMRNKYIHCEVGGIYCCSPEWVLHKGIVAHCLAPWKRMGGKVSQNIDWRVYYYRKPRESFSLDSPSAFWDEEAMVSLVG